MHRMSWSVALATALWLIAAPPPALAQNQTQTANGQAARAAPAGPSPARPSPELTGKERLSEKWTDEQRVDNCKVPLDKRGPKPRPDACSEVPTD